MMPSVSSPFIPSPGPREEKKRRGLKFHTGEEIGARIPDPITFLTWPLFVAGMLVELTGAAKGAGKTTLLLRIIRAMLTGDFFLGRTTHRCPVIFATEESERSFRRNLANAGLLDAADLHVVYLTESLHLELPEVISEIAIKAQEVGAGVVVIDTAPAWARMAGEEENQSGPVLECVAQFRRLADRGLAVLIVRHDRKMGGELGQSGRGSSAWAAAVDILANLRRIKGAATYRVLSTLGRADDLPEALLLNLTPDGYEVVQKPGSDDTSAIVPTYESVYAVLPEGEAEALDVAAVAKASQLSTSQAKRALDVLLGEQRIEKTGTGKPRHPYLYRRASLLSSHPNPLGMDVGREEEGT